jgi:hypothetical protein
MWSRVLTLVQFQYHFCQAKSRDKDGQTFPIRLTDERIGLPHRRAARTIVPVLCSKWGSEALGLEETAYRQGRGRQIATLKQLQESRAARKSLYSHKELARKHLNHDGAVGRCGKRDSPRYPLGVPDLKRNHSPSSLYSSPLS